MFGGLFWGRKRRNRGLRDAASGGNVQQLMWLLARGVDVDDPDPLNGETALGLAVKGAHLDAVRTLLLGGATATHQFRQRYPGLFVAVSFGDTSLEVEASLPVPAPLPVPEPEPEPEPEPDVDLASGDEDHQEEQGAPQADPAPGPRARYDDPSDTPPRTRANWLAMYERLRDYRGVHGHADVPTQWPKDPKLAVWVSNQRQRRKKNSATEEEIALLDQLDFTWAMRERGTWDDRLQELIDFISTHGHFDVPTDYPPAPKLKQFIASSRYQNRRGELSPERQHKLNEIGFPWGAIEAAAGDMSQATDALPEARAPLSYSALAEVVLAGKTVAITGRFEQLSQSEAQALVEGLGARVVDKMSGQVDVLVAGYDVGTKFADATDRGILILGELDLLHLAKPDRPEYI
jgi:hypothetical protein